MEYLWKEQEMTDVILATMDEQRLQAHKLILYYGSTFFKNIFMKNSNRNLFIYLKDIQYKYLKMLLEYLYTGQCQVEERELQDFLSVGKDLGVIVLLDKVNCTEVNIHIEDNISDIEREENIEIQKKVKGKVQSIQ